MVVRMMRWRPWPPLVTRKYKVRLVVRRLEGWRTDQVGEDAEKLGVEIRWKGQKVAFTSLRRRAKEAKRNLTREVCCGDNGVVSWDEEFHATCNLSLYKDNNVFHPWEISFSLVNGANVGTKNKAAIIGTASLNLADYASGAQEEDLQLDIPLSLSSATPEITPSLCVSVGLLELRNAQESTESRAVVPVPSSPMTGETPSLEKDEVSAIKVGLRKVKFFTDYVSARRSKKACCEDEDSEGRGSSKTEDGDYAFTLDSDSFDSEEGESEEVKEDDSIRKSFSYGTLAYANCAGGSFFSSARIGGEEDDWVYYSHRKSDVGCSLKEDVSEPSLLQTSKRSILSWRKRKLSFRSPKAKGEPLLKKAYAEEGGDDIDYDRRQLSSDESHSLQSNKSGDDATTNRLSVSEFGDDNFAIGTWEQKDIISRDGLLKLQTQVFFASIDQRNERAAGESACTGLVTVIADWFQSNRGMLPIKSQFDSLIQEGSLEWRRLCENAVYRERFPDKHFDLETVLQAKIRPLSVVACKSFIGFFHPEGMEEGSFGFLQGAMSFDSIWDEISRAAAEIPDNGEPLIYIVSWNDHFFVLKVEPEAYYIIDTLGERLYEGCNQAYILKFDRNTVICDMPKTSQPQEVNITGNKQTISELNTRKEVSGAEPVTTESRKTDDEMRIICQGKESCKEYIKSFLAAIPIRELLVDIKKGLMSSTPLHHRLQIEFHFTQLLQPETEVPETRGIITAAQAAEVGRSDDAITAQRLDVDI